METQKREIKAQKILFYQFLKESDEIMLFSNISTSLINIILDYTFQSNHPFHLELLLSTKVVLQYLDFENKLSVKSDKFIIVNSRCFGWFPHIKITCLSCDK